MKNKEQRGKNVAKNPERGPAPAAEFWFPAWITLALAAGWIAWAGKSYFAHPNHVPAVLTAIDRFFATPFAKIFSTPFSLWVSHAGNALWVSIFLFIAYHAGDWILDKLRIRAPDRLAHGGMAIGLGLASLSFLNFLLACVHLLHPAVLLAAQAALLAFAAWRHKRRFGVPALRVPLGAWARSSSLSEKAAAFVLLLFLGTIAGAAFCPEIFYDSLVYHLALPSLWLQNRGFVPLPFLAFSTMPSLIQLGYAWSLAAAGALPFLHGDTMAKLLHFAMGLVTMAALYGLAAPRWGRLTGLLSALFYLAIPVVSMNAWTSGNDVGTGLYQTLGVLALIYWFESVKSRTPPPQDAAAGSPPRAESTDPVRWWILSAVFLGAALLSKYTAVFAVAAACLAAAVLNLRHAPAGSRFRPILVYGLVVLAAWSPWLIKNAVTTGNPVHPFLWGYLGGQNIGDALKWQGGAKNVFFGAEFNIVHFLRLDFLWKFISSFWRVAMEGNDSVKYAGPVLLLFSPLLLLFRRWPPAIRIAGSTFLLAYFFWFLGNEFARYLAPAYPCVALALAWGWTALSGRFGRAGKAGIAVPLLCAVAVWGSLALIVFYTHTPWMYLTGQTSRDDYLSHGRSSYPNPSYALYRYINRSLPKEGVRLLLVGDNKAYSLQRDFYYYTVEYNNPILQTWIKESRSEEEIFEKARRERITHLVINYREFLRLHHHAWEERDKAVFAKFWDRYVSGPVHFAEGCFLYELRPDLPPGRQPPLNVILEMEKSGFKSQSLLNVFLEHRLWDPAIEEVESWARFGAPVHDYLASLYLNRGKEGDREKAAQSLRAAIERAPGNVQLYKQLISVYLQSGDTASALPYVQSAVQIAPQDADLQRLFLSLIQSRR